MIRNMMYFRRIDENLIVDPERPYAIYHMYNLPGEETVMHIRQNASFLRGYAYGQEEGRREEDELKICNEWPIHLEGYFPEVDPEEPGGFDRIKLSDKPVGRDEIISIFGDFFVENDHPYLLE